MDKLLKSVKLALGITIEDEDINSNIKLKIKAVAIYLANGGAILPEKEEDYNDNLISCIAIGVNDLLNNSSGETKFSPAFSLMATQICCRGGA